MEFVRDAPYIAEEDATPAGDLANLCHRDSGNARRNAFGPRGRKQQFVVFAPMQGEIEFHFTGGLADARPRNQSGIDLGAYSAFLTDMRQVGREPITRIDHGRSQVLLAKNASKFESRLRIEVAQVAPWIHLLST